MNVSVRIDLTVPALEKHWQQMRRAAGVLTNEKSSVQVAQDANNPKRLTARFTVPNAPQGDVVDHIGHEFLNWIEDFSDSAIGFGPEPRRSRTRQHGTHPLP